MTDTTDDQEQYSDNYEEFLRKVRPEWSEKQIQIAVDDHRTRNLGLPSLAEKNFAQRMREWITLQSGEFRTRDIIEELDISKEKKGQVSVYLNRFIEERLIRRVGTKAGHFRRIESDAPIIDLFSTEEKTLNLKLPFGLHEMIKIYPGNVITIGGWRNTGKTTILLNTAIDNMQDYEVTYFTSELGRGELKDRCRNFEDMAWPNDWRRIEFRELKNPIYCADVIKPGETKLNFIDYLEMHTEFYLINQYLSEIHKQLDGAIAIVALQMKHGASAAYGGDWSEMLPRLCLTTDSEYPKGNVLTIRKAKNWRGRQNPNGSQIHYKVINGGSKLVQTDQWTLPES